MNLGNVEFHNLYAETLWLDTEFRIFKTCNINVFVLVHDELKMTRNAWLGDPHIQGCNVFASGKSYSDSELRCFFYMKQNSMVICRHYCPFLF